MTNIAILIGDISRGAGTERAVTNLANMLAESGSYVVTVISLYSSGGSQCYYPINHSVDAVHLGFARSGMAKRLVVYIKFVHSVNAIIRDKHIDVVLGTTHALNSLLFFMSRKTKKIACEHMNYESAPFYSKIFRRFTYPFLDAVVCLTERDANHYPFVKKGKLFVIPNSLSFKCERPSECLNKKIIAVGRLTRQKGFDMLLESAAVMKSCLHGWELCIFGDGEDGELLLQKAAELDISDFVTFHSVTKNIEEQYCDSSIMVVSSRWEGFPMVIVEAQSCGLPVVTFDCPYGPSDIVKDKETGFVVPLFDTKALAEKTIELALDENKRKLFGMRAKELSKRFSTENVARLWKDVLEKVCCYK